MNRVLHVSKYLTLPRETVTQTLAILARKRSGPFGVGQFQ